MTPEDRAIENFNKSFDALTKRSAISLGQPAGTRPVGDAELVRQWGIMDNKVDRTALAQQLMAGGLPPELLDPNSPHKLEIVKAAPDLAPLYGQPVQDPEVADILAGLAEHPFRHGILAAIDDPEDQVKETARLNRLWEKQMAERQPAEQSGAEMSSPMSANVRQSDAKATPMSAAAPAMSAPMSVSAEPSAPAISAAPALPDQSMTMGG
jgi:hypothetical protein